MSKLYTEEQLRKAITWAQKSSNVFSTPLIYDEDDVIEQITPIELPSYDKVTRLEVISKDGRELVKHGVNVELQLQDENRTLKVFTKIQGGKNE